MCRTCSGAFEILDECVGDVDSGLHVFMELEGFVDCDAVSPDDSQMDLENIKLCSRAACAQICAHNNYTVH